jgi:hypothetical protein
VLTALSALAGTRAARGAGRHGSRSLPRGDDGHGTPAEPPAPAASRAFDACSPVAVVVYAIAVVSRSDQDRLAVRQLTSPRRSRRSHRLATSNIGWIAVPFAAPDGVNQPRLRSLLELPPQLAVDGRVERRMARVVRSRGRTAPSSA